MSIPAADAFAAMARLPLVPFAQICARRILVVAPHPDDESIGCGGLIRLARDAGVPVTIVIVSDGTGSHPASQAYPPERLRAVREGEALEAARILGVAPQDVHFLREHDRFVPTTGPAAERLAQIIVAIGADFIAVSWNADPHCDHKASFALAREARHRTGGRLYAYPVWALALPPDARIEAPPSGGFNLPVDTVRDARRQAIAAHRSQTTDLIGDDPDGFRLTPAHLALFDRPVETYLEVPA